MNDTLLLTYTPVIQHTFPQTGPGYPAFDEQGNVVGKHPECRHCRAYGTTYGLRFSNDPNSFAVETGFFACDACEGNMWAPYAFREVN